MGWMGWWLHYWYQSHRLFFQQFPGIIALPGFLKLTFYFLLSLSERFVYRCCKFKEKSLSCKDNDVCLPLRWSFINPQKALIIVEILNEAVIDLVHSTSLDTVALTERAVAVTITCPIFFVIVVEAVNPALIARLQATALLIITEADNVVITALV